MHKMQILSNTLLALILTTMSVVSQAAMSISGTRIIFPASEKEVSVRTNNKGSLPALVQVWIDDGSNRENINQIKTPFIVMPPIYRVEPSKGQSVRLVYNGMPLPTDRESVFWFNLLEIPPKAANDSQYKLELAFRTRIKIFYRPTSLEKSGVESQQEKLKWITSYSQGKGIGIRVINPTPYHFSFDTVNVISNSKRIELEVGMVPPFNEKTFYSKQKIDDINSISGVKYSLINEYGALIERKMIYRNKAFVFEKQ